MCVLVFRSAGVLMIVTVVRLVVVVVVPVRVNLMTGVVNGGVDVRAPFRDDGLRIPGGPFLETELRSGDARARHPIRAQLVVEDPEAAEGPAQVLERESRVEARAQDHVAGGAVEAIEVED